MGELTMSGILFNVLLKATSYLNIMLFVSSQKFGEIGRLPKASDRILYSRKWPVEADFFGNPIARLPAATKVFTAETAEFAEKTQEKLCALRVLCGERFARIRQMSDGNTL